MKIAVISPDRAFLCGENSMHKYAEVFMRKYCEKEVTREQSKVYTGEVIISFNGRPDIIDNVPSHEFKGLKIVSLMDYVFNPSQSYQNLRKNDVDFVLGYNHHDLHDDFFCKMFPGYVGKVIPTNFGFNSRFSNKKPYKERIQKCVGVGSINPVDEGLLELTEYVSFFKGQYWSHPWRNELRHQWNSQKISDILDSYFPEVSLHGNKRFDYNIVDVFNQYQMFTTCESITNFPSVKVFEGMASGSVFVGNDVPCYKYIGLKNGINCLLHRPNDVSDFVKVVKENLINQTKLETIARNGVEFVRANFSAERIAERLFETISLL